MPVLLWCTNKFTHPGIRHQPHQPRPNPPVPSPERRAFGSVTRERIPVTIRFSLPTFERTRLYGKLSAGKAPSRGTKLRFYARNGSRLVRCFEYSPPFSTVDVVCAHAFMSDIQGLRGTGSLLRRFLRSLSRRDIRYHPFSSAIAGDLAREASPIKADGTEADDTLCIGRRILWIVCCSGKGQPREY